jgi:hypothetical protein
MPAPSTFRVRTNETATGPLVLSYFVSETSPTVAYSFIHNTFPTNVNATAAVFDLGLQRALGSDGRLLTNREIELAGNPGREWQFDKLKGRATVTMRAYWVGRDFYQVICLMPKSLVCQGHVTDFLESCKLERP